MHTIMQLTVYFCLLPISLFGITLTDNQGRSLEAEDITIENGQVTFTKTGTNQNYTVPLDSLSAETITALIPKEPQDSEKSEDEDPFPAVSESIRPEIEPLTLYKKNGGMIQHVVPVQVIDGILHYENAIINIESWKSYSIPLTELDAKSQQLIELFFAPLEEVVPEKDMSVKPELLVDYPTDFEFYNWVNFWAAEAFGRDPEFPQPVLLALHDNRELLVEYMEAVTFKDEIRNYPAIAPWAAHPAYNHYGQVKAQANDMPGAKLVIRRLYEEDPEVFLENIRLGLALSLLHDNPEDTMQAAKITNGKSQFFSSNLEFLDKKWLSPYELVWEWKTDSRKQRNFHYQNDELSIEAHAWASKTRQDIEGFDWGQKQKLRDDDLDRMFSDLPLTNKPPESALLFGPVEEIPAGAPHTQAYVAEERLMAYNVPVAFCVGYWNEEPQQDEHPYVYGLLNDKEGNRHVLSGGRQHLASGWTVLPTNQGHIPEGFFHLRMSDRYNDPTSQKLRLKLQWALGIRKKSTRVKALQDIFLEDPTFSAAQAHLLIEGEFTSVTPREHSLDNAWMYQILALHYQRRGQDDKALEYFEAMLQSEPDENIRLGWGLHTITQLRSSKQITWAPYLAKHVPHYPGSFFSYIYLRHGNQYNDLLESYRAAQKASDSTKFRSMLNDVKYEHPLEWN